MKDALERSAAGSLGADTRGSVTVEYTVLLVLVALGAAAALVAIGPLLARMFWAQQVWLSLAVP